MKDLERVSRGWGEDLKRIWGGSVEDLRFGKMWGRSGEDLRKIWTGSGPVSSLTIVTDVYIEDLDRIWRGSGKDLGGSERF